MRNHLCAICLLHTVIYGKACSFHYSWWCHDTGSVQILVLQFLWQKKKKKKNIVNILKISTHCFFVSPKSLQMQLQPKNIWAPSSEFVSSSIPSWQILTAHARTLRGARDLAFYLKVPLDSLLVWASSGGSGETARMRRLAWTSAQSRLNLRCSHRL